MDDEYETGVDIDTILHEPDEKNEEDEDEIHEIGNNDNTPAVSQVARYIYVPKEERISSNYMTKYEEARIISVRAAQIAQSGHQIFSKEKIRSDECTANAIQELNEQRSPVLLYRIIEKDENTNDKIVEIWDPKEMNHP